MQNRQLLQAGLCLIIATIFALTSHIYLEEWTKPILDSLSQDLNINQSYSPMIITAAYGTAFITIGVIVFLYYHAQHLLPIRSNLLKAVTIAAFILELKGYLIRQPLMDALVIYSSGMSGVLPLKIVGLNILNTWTPTLLSALSLVYLCPKKVASSSTPK